MFILPAVLGKGGGTGERGSYLTPVVYLCIWLLRLPRRLCRRTRILSSGIMMIDLQWISKILPQASVRRFEKRRIVEVQGPANTNSLLQGQALYSSPLTSSHSQKFGQHHCSHFRSSIFLQRGRSILPVKSFRY